MIDLGADLSLARTGLVLMSGDQVLEWAVVPTAPNHDVEYDLQERIDAISRFVMRLARRADLVTIEGHAFGVTHGDTRPHELVALVKWKLWRRRIPFMVVTPSAVKKFATGNGRATKQQMVQAARDFGFTDTKDHNVADALHLARHAVNRRRMAVAPG